MSRAIEAAKSAQEMAPPPREPKRANVPRFLFAVVRPFRAFFHLEAAGGISLIITTAVALAWANSRYAELYESLLHFPVTISFGGRGLSWPLHHWINDALMSVFFLVVGMEIKRELLVGELRTLGRATLPLVAALGGMVVPAAIHFALNRGTPSQAGWGIPMATDIAFALGCLALVSRRVPSAMVVFLMALAIFDDLGAILVIALFYGSGIHAGALIVAGALTAVLILFVLAGVTRVWPYVVVGVALWVAVLQSGIHATIAGVVLGLCIPARASRRPSEILDDLDQAVRRLRGTEDSDLDAAGPIGAIERHLESVQPPLDRMVHGLHAWVAFAIVPLFALANAGVALATDVAQLAASPASLGVMLGLFVGKPVGIFGATWVAVRLGLAPRPDGASWLQVLGIAILAGIGFTMSIFVATLAFPSDAALQDASKVGIFAGSLASAVVGLGLLRAVGDPRAAPDTTEDIAVVIDLPKYAEGYHVEPWAAAGAVVGQSLREVDLRRRFGVQVIGIHAGGLGSESDRGLEPVGPEYVIAAGDTLVLVGPPSDVARFVDAAVAPAARVEPSAD
jgi:NhaA family Na+:H+ antiporter